MSKRPPTGEDLQQPTKPCVRGCTQACHCSACRDAGTTQHKPVPRPAKDGHLCIRCAGNLNDWLTDIPNLYATLDARMQRGEKIGGGKQGKISGSPALARLNVMAMLDPKTFPGPGKPSEWDGKREDDDGIYDIAGAVCTWAAMFTEEQHHDTDVSTLSAACSHLRAWFATVTEQPWVDEMYLEFRDLIGLLNSAHGIPKPKIVGHCMSMIGEGKETKRCNKALYAGTGTTIIKCSDCGRQYDGREIIRLRVVEMHENGATVALEEAV